MTGPQPKECPRRPLRRSCVGQQLICTANPTRSVSREVACGWEPRSLTLGVRPPDRGVIHRDIKPPNLLLDARGNVWVTDFGLAKLVEGDELSQSHDLVGTLRFMAPERLRGITNPAGDVYSLGATLYELLTLKPAFAERCQARLIDQITHELPAPLRHHDHRIPKDLETLVLKALAKDPKDRFAAAGELADELRRYLESRPIRSRSVGPTERLWRWCKRSPGQAAAASLTMILAISTTIAAWIFYHQRVQISNVLVQARDSERRGRSRH